MTHTTLNAEAAQQIEEALAFAASHSEYLADDLILYGEALATIRASRAQANIRSSSRSASEYSEQAEQTNTQLIEGYRIGLAEMREKCARLCENRLDYYGVGYAHGLVTEKLAEAIRAINFEGDTGFRPASEMIAEEEPLKQESVSYVDSTPHLHVGDSSFEDWYQSHPKASGGDKQLARDAYAAGMGDPLVAAVEPVKQEPVGVKNGGIGAEPANCGVLSVGVNPEAIGQWHGQSNIESPLNACQHKSYCCQLKNAALTPVKQAPAAIVHLKKLMFKDVHINNHEWIEWLQPKQDGMLLYGAPVGLPKSDGADLSVYINTIFEVVSDVANNLGEIADGVPTQSMCDAICAEVDKLFALLPASAVVTPDAGGEGFDEANAVAKLSMVVDGLREARLLVAQNDAFTLAQKHTVNQWLLAAQVLLRSIGKAVEAIDAKSTPNPEEPL